MKSHNFELSWNRAIGVAAVLALAVALPVFGQATAKQGEAVAKTAESIQGSLKSVVDDYRTSLTLYNAVIDGDAKKRQSNYKKLVSQLKTADKDTQDAQKNADALTKQTDKFYKTWEKDNAAFTSDDMKQRSEQQLEDAKAKYAAVVETVKQASETTKPLAASFNDQVIYLGRDLSDTAVESIKPDAEKLNAQAEDVLNQLEALLNGDAAPADASTGAPADADAKADADAAPDAPAEEAPEKEEGSGN